MFQRKILFMIFGSTKSYKYSWLYITNVYDKTCVLGHTQTCMTAQQRQSNQKYLTIQPSITYLLHAWIDVMQTKCLSLLKLTHQLLMTGYPVQPN